MASDLAAIDKEVASHRQTNRNSPLKIPIHEEYRRHKNVVVAPLQGLMGSTEVDAEGNAIARQMGSFFGGEDPLQIPAWATLAGARRQKSKDDYRAGIVPPAVLDHWKWTDLVVTTGAHPRPSTYRAGSGGLG